MGAEGWGQRQPQKGLPHPLGCLLPSPVPARPTPSPNGLAGSLGTPSKCALPRARALPPPTRASLLSLVLTVNFTPTARPASDLYVTPSKSSQRLHLPRLVQGQGWFPRARGRLGLWPLLCTLEGHFASLRRAAESEGFKQAQRKMNRLVKCQDQVSEDRVSHGLPGTPSCACPSVSLCSLFKSPGFPQLALGSQAIPPSHGMFNRHFPGAGM